MSKCIFDITSNIWVNANAGAGKTTALISRLLKLFLSGYDPKEVLCITYTNIASNEIITRINQKLRYLNNIDDIALATELQKLDLGNPDNNAIKQRINVLLNSIDDYQILTIHAFAFKLLKQYNLITANTIISDSTKEEIIDIVYNNIINNTDNILNHIDLGFFYKEISWFCVKEVIRETIGKINDFDKILNDSSDAYTLMPNEALSVVNCDTEVELNRIINNIDIIDESSNFSKIIDKNRYLSEKEVNTLRSFREVNVNDKNQCIDFIATLEKLLCNDNLELRSVFKKSNELAHDAETIFNLFMRYKSINNAKAQLVLNKIIIFTYNFYRSFCNKNNLISYNDILHNTIKVLSNIDYQWIRYSIDLKFSHILLDESQDTSPECWEIIKLLSEEFFIGYGTRDDKKRTLFVVGDPKQSIYQFQGANLHLYYYYQSFFRQKGLECNNEFLFIDLKESYRSSQDILDLVDSFCNTPSYSSAFTNGDNAIQHVAKFDIKSLIEIIDVSKKTDSRQANLTSNDWMRSIFDYQSNDNDIIDAIIDKIKYSVNQLNNKYSDICVLFHTRSVSGNLFYKVINKMETENIPFTVNDDIRNDLLFFDIRSLINFILYDYDDLSLASFLKSDFCGLTDEDIVFIVKSTNKKITLYNKLQNLVTSNERIIAAIKKLALIKANYGVNDSLYSVLSDIVKIFVNDLDSKNKPTYQSYINSIIDFIVLKESVISGLSELLTEIDKEDNFFIIKGSHDEANATTISTVHGVKGLEYKTVIYIDISNNKQKPSFLLLDNKVRYKLYKSMDSIISSAFALNDTDVYLESLRLSYVALTRSQNNIFYFTDKVFKN